jgi:excinuclease UvrABC nuclease subunit
MAREPATIDLAASPETVEARIAAAPDGPAVFLVWPREAAPYLGRTSVLRRRLKRLLGERPAPSRWLNLRQVACRVEYWLAGSALETGLLFYELARRHFPETYRDLIHLRMPPYVRLILSNPFPRTQVTTRLGGKGLFCGPFRNRAAADQFEGATLDLFQIRRCQEDLQPSPAHPGCIYGEMSKCLRPCQQAVSADEYRGEVERMAAFLRTEGRSLVEPLEAARQKLSEELRFEDAAREHARIEKIQEVLRLRDSLAADIDQLCGVAVTASAEPGAVELWFVIAGCWQPAARFGFEVVEGRTISMDQRLRELVAAIEPRRPAVEERQEHLALLTRWFHSSWRDGEWLAFPALERVPYRKLVNAISRVASGAPARGADSAPRPQ